MKNFIVIIFLSAFVLTACKSKEEQAIEQAKFDALISSKVDSLKENLKDGLKIQQRMGATESELHFMYSHKMDSTAKALEMQIIERWSNRNTENGKKLASNKPAGDFYDYKDISANELMYDSDQIDSIISDYRQQLIKQYKQ